MNQLRIQFPFFQIQDSLNQLVIQQELYLRFRIQWISSGFSFLFLRFRIQWIGSGFSKNSFLRFRIQWISSGISPQDSVPFFYDSGFSESAQDSARTPSKIQNSVNQLRIQQKLFLRFRIQWISSGFSSLFLRCRIEWISSGILNLKIKGTESWADSLNPESLTRN